MTGAYRPPHLDVFDEDSCDPAERDDSSEGSWTCETRPPQLR